MPALCAGIHEEMLKDSVRTRSYMQSIMNNKVRVLEHLPHSHKLVHPHSRRAARLVEPGHDPPFFGGFHHHSTHARVTRAYC